ncbi:MAG TPA: hypothetical protein VMM76_13050 [Pirellulaceae bacterium]|nr:hypothetical protein [Pirellulaceae bacterium]
MKTTGLWIIWILLPVGLAAWHFGPGQRLLHSDLAADQLKLGRRAETIGDWKTAAVSYSLANHQWPEDSVSARRRIRLAEANATINAGNLIVGQEQLESLISEMEEDEQADGDLLAAARHGLGTSCYYAAWMMRLEGAEADEWLQEAELARQQFRLLAETSDGGQQQQVAAENLEATIRLEQMDLRTLMAKPLPKNCCSNCNSLCQQKRKQMASRCKEGNKEGKKKEDPTDARKQIKTNSAGLNAGGRGGS